MFFRWSPNGIDAYTKVLFQSKQKLNSLWSWADKHVSHVFNPTTTFFISHIQYSCTGEQNKLKYCVVVLYRISSF